MLEDDLRRMHRLHRGPRTIGRQVELVGDRREFGLPERDLTAGDRLGVRVVAEDFSLPQREVGVLDRERLETAGFAVESPLVGRHEVARERRDRHAVARDVMHDEHDDVHVRSRLEDTHTQRRTRGHVDSGTDEFFHGHAQSGAIRDWSDAHRRGRIGRGQDFLARPDLVGWEYRAQRLVTRDDVAQSL